MKVSHTKFNNSVGREFIMKQYRKDCSKKKRAAELLEREGFEKYGEGYYELCLDVYRYDAVKDMLRREETAVFVELDEDGWNVRIEFDFCAKFAYSHPHLFRVWLMRFLSQIAEENRMNRSKAKFETCESFDIDTMTIDIEIADLEWPTWHSDEEERVRNELRDEYGADVIPLSFEFSDSIDENGIEIYAIAACDKRVHNGLSSKICMDLSVALAEHIESETGIEEIDCPDDWVEFNHLNNVIEFAFNIRRY